MGYPSVGKDDELIELVNDQGEVIGTELRSVAYAKHHKNIRIAEVFLMNSKKEIFLAKRAADRKTAPGLYECCAEHVHPGESDQMAALRGLKEELSLDVDPGQLVFLGYTTPTDGAWGYSAVFLVGSDAEPELSKEHDGGEWMSRIAIMKMLKEDSRQFRSNVRIHFWKYAPQLFG